MNSKGKVYSSMMMAAAMAAMMPGNDMFNDYEKELTSEEIEEIKRVREAKALERKLKKGLKEWNIDGFCIIALNRKNAERKAAILRAAIKDACV